MYLQSSTMINGCTPGHAGYTLGHVGHALGHAGYENQMCPRELCLIRGIWDTTGGRTNPVS